MTHKDIYTKFMIEYDKADITSSYPSLTLYETATILDKAYVALINLKVTGNNSRQVLFEGDNKAIEDIRPLISTVSINTSSVQDYTNASNEVDFEIPDNMMFYVQSNVETDSEISSSDNRKHQSLNVNLVTHEVALKFMNTMTNMPWIVQPVLYIENNKFHVVFDSFPNFKVEKLILTYIVRPNKFALENETADFTDTSIFQLSDSMAEELINLAIIFATRIVQDPRLSAEVETRPLES